MAASRRREAFGKKTASISAAQAPPISEVHFFSRNLRGRGGVVALSMVAELFREVSQESVQSVSI